MSEQRPDSSFCQAFECLHIDSAANGALFPVTPHSHYYTEVMLVRSGTCRVMRGTHPYVLKPGELLYIAPLIRHSVESADGKPVAYDIVKFSATRLREIPSYLSDLRSFSMDASHNHLQVHMKAEDVQFWHLDNIVKECVYESEQQGFAWDLQTRALIYLLITGLARFWLTNFGSLMQNPPDERDPILDIPAYIEQHISEPLRVEDLARRCSLSYPWFAKRFHEFFGLSCKQFIEHIRTETVEQYLVYSDLDLSEISSRTGYTDSSHMVKDFRRMTGMTPGQFRSVMKAQGRAPFSRISAQALPIHASKG